MRPVIGTLKRSPFGGGYLLETDDGQTLSLRGEVPASCKEGRKVRVEGTLQDDAVSIDMVGPVLLVKRIVPV